MVFLSGYRSDMSGTKAVYLDRVCEGLGQSYLRFDYSGHGQSDGNFADGTISCDLKDGAPVDLLRRLTDFLEISTGRVWDVQRARTARETVKEGEERMRAERIASVRAHPDVSAALAALPGLQIVDVTSGPALEPARVEGNVVPLRAASQKKG